MECRGHLASDRIVLCRPISATEIGRVFLCNAGESLPLCEMTIVSGSDAQASECFVASLIDGRQDIP